MSKSEEEKRIADAAYHLWEKEGRPQGRDMDLWLRARAELEAAEPAPKTRRAPARKAAPAKPKTAAAKPKALAKSKAPAQPKAAAAAAAKPVARTAKPKPAKK